MATTPTSSQIVRPRRSATISGNLVSGVEGGKVKLSVKAADAMKKEQEA